MKSLFRSADRDEVMSRIDALQPDAAAQWGKMNAAQMLRHCAIALENGTGERPMKQKLLGKVLVPLIRKAVFGEKPFRRNGPTDPRFVVSDACDFTAERSRVKELIDRFARRGEAAAANETHPFFGKLSGADWGVLMYKHLDHHLRQFGS